MPGGVGEFDLIARYFAPLAQDAPLAFDLTDDAALLQPAEGTELVLTTDCMVAGVHFLADDEPSLIARKLLRVNLSDLAAMGASVRGYLLAAAFPQNMDEAWIAAFAQGLMADQQQFGLQLLGGDTVATEGQMTLTVTAIGQVPAGRALRRSGARPGDLLCASGAIGDAAIGLAFKQGRLALESAEALLTRLHLPEPRLQLGQRLVGLATACIDISDGLVQDVGHIAATSSVRIEIVAGDVPLSPDVARVVAADPGNLTTVLTGGDDYELAFTISETDRHRLQALNVPVRVIGRVNAGAGVAVFGADGSALSLEQTGYQHFKR